ncbi:hypothetical protein N0V84_001518 [Fusarium piperis]|uniref:Uncharacterized protein n=1 Tax=Fusarium piperis TaxID=1435070 RepID=A0A9W8WKQ7_9HYPO|nr:hypothetical protein N0V84_001518 [Fusarium piperis]
MRGKRPTPLSPRSFPVAIAQAVRGYDPQASNAQGGSTVQQPYELDGTPLDSSSQNGGTCVEGCNKKCPKNNCVEAGPHGVTFNLDDEISPHPETSESESQPSTESSKEIAEGKMVANRATTNSSSADSTENGDEASTDADTSGEASTSEENASCSEDESSGDADDEFQSDSNADSSEDESENDDDDDDDDDKSDQSSNVDSDQDSDSDEEDASPKGKGKRKSPIHNKWHSGIRNNEIAAENKKAKAKASQQDNQYPSGEDASSESSDVESSSPNTKNIIDEPDEDLCKKDSELPGSIHSRQKMSRWLEMQINFHNVTGCLIPLELIKAKCEREEADSDARRAERAVDREEEGRHKVEEWIKDVPDDEEEEEEEESEESEDDDDEEDSEDDEEGSDDSES